MSVRYLLFIALLLTFQGRAQSQDNSAAVFTQTEAYFFHTVERGETVYSLSVMYGVSTEAIYVLNPGSKESIKIGETLKIPQKSQRIVFHTIQPKETLYSVSKKYNISGEDLLLENPGLSVQTFTIGKTILIPVYKELSIGADGKTAADAQESKVNALLKQPAYSPKTGAAKIALLLPFGTVDASQSTESNSQRFVEYYEGILMAIDSLKRTGVSVDLQVYDIGYKKNSLEKVLEKTELTTAQLIIGGFTEEQINTIALYAKGRFIRYVIPFASKANETMNNPFIFQSNPPHSYIYSKVSLAFTQRYKKRQIIFVNTDETNDKEELIKYIQTDLKSENIHYKTLRYQSATILADLKNAIDITRKNVIVLSSGSTDALSKIALPLRQLREGGSSTEVSLFGYPEWQTYAKDYTDDLFLNNTAIYSVFFADNTNPATQAFQRSYSKWYSKAMIYTYPKYAMLGYDTGMYFISMINRYGIAFENSLNKYRYQGLQSSYQLERVSNWGGFINLNVYWVDYKNDYTTHREDIR